MLSDIAKIAEARAKATPGEWQWWTSNSHCRLGSGDTDGNVAWADGDSIIISDADRKLIRLAANLDWQALRVRLAIAEQVVKAAEAVESIEAKEADMGKIYPPGTCNAEDAWRDFGKFKRESWAALRESLTAWHTANEGE